MQICRCRFLIFVFFPEHEIPKIKYKGLKLFCKSYKTKTHKIPEHRILCVVNSKSNSFANLKLSRFRRKILLVSVVFGFGC